MNYNDKSECLHEAERRGEINGARRSSALTKLEYFAGQALIGLLANPDRKWDEIETDAVDIAEDLLKAIAMKEIDEEGYAAERAAEEGETK